jgi:hypothetical protein
VPQGHQKTITVLNRNKKPIHMDGENNKIIKNSIKLSVEKYYLMNGN